MSHNILKFIKNLINYYFYMPYRRRKRPTRKPRRRPRRYIRRRKNGYNYAKLNTTIAPNNLFVKLKYAKPFTVTAVAANSFVDLIVGGNMLAPTGPDVTDNFPGYPNLGQTIISAGSQLWLGLSAYAHLYSHLTIFSSKINFKIISDATAGASTNVNLQVLGGAWSEEGFQGANVANVQTNSLILQKGVKNRVIAGGAGQNKASIVMARSTKKMLGVKDYRDRNFSWNDINPTFNVTQLTNCGSMNQWYYYIRVANPNSIPVDFTWTFDLQANAMFSGRSFWQSNNAISGGGPGEE